MHCDGKVLRSQLLHRAAVQCQRTAVHSEQSDAAAAGHGQCAGLVLDYLALFIKADGADIDTVNALPVQIQGDIARDKRHVCRILIGWRIDVRLQLDGAAVALIGVCNRILVDIKGDLAARCNDGRRASVRSKYRQRHHGKYHDDRQQHGKYPLFQCHVCVHFVTPLHASCNRRREDLRGNRLFMKIRTAEPVGLYAESVIIRKPQHRDIFANAFGGDHALHAVCAVHRYHDAVRRAFSESCDKAVIIRIACYLHFTVT